MIYEFKSRATGTIVMTGKVAERMLGIIGKPAEAKGIVTVAQLPAALASLRSASEDERRAIELAQAQTAGAPHDRDAEDDGARGDVISLAQRASPLIEMFERALAAERDVTWGI